MAIFNGTSANMASVGGGAAVGAAGGANIPATAAQVLTMATQNYNTTTFLPVQNGAAGQYYTTNVGAGGHISASFAPQKSSNVIPISVYDKDGKEIVRLEPDGTVVWSKDIDIDEAAAAFGKSIQLGAEISAGITYGVKQRMRDVVFEEIISMAQEKGSITAEELTYLHKAAKIIDKLKGKV